jgi:ferredoxin
MKVKVDWLLCDGNGNCAVEAPEIFALDDNDELTLLMEEVPPELRPRAEAAVRACPKRALKLTSGGSS